MNRSAHLSRLAISALLAGALVTMLGCAQPPKENAGKPPEVHPPSEGNAADMQAYVIAGTPGEPHKTFARHVGLWQGKTKMWAGPGVTETMNGTCTNTVSLVMDGRFMKSEMDGELPGMGRFLGLGFVGFDNVSGTYVGTWLDNQSTGIMNGTGTVSKDGKTMTWSYTYNCPVTRKATSVREIQTWTGENSMTYDGFTIDPQSGKEYQCMQINFTRKP